MKADPAWDGASICRLEDRNDDGNHALSVDVRDCVLEDELRLLRTLPESGRTRRAVAANTSPKQPVRTILLIALPTPISQQLRRGRRHCSVSVTQSQRDPSTDVQGFRIIACICPNSQSAAR
jgi:hypothetical protein